MHTDQTKSQFIELRSQGRSLARIAEDISVSKRTLVEWNRQCRAELRALRAVELERLHETLLASHEQELSSLAVCQKKIAQVLAQRSFGGINTGTLVRLDSQIRRQIRELRHDLDPLDEPTQTGCKPPPPEPPTHHDYEI